MATQQQYYSFAKQHDHRHHTSSRGIAGVVFSTAVCKTVALQR